MKKFLWSFIKHLLLIALVISSSVAIAIKYNGNQFDPIREIQKLRDENRRDDALDLARFLQYSDQEDNQKFIELVNTELGSDHAERMIISDLC